jgi:hypothetical protein
VSLEARFLLKRRALSRCTRPVERRRTRSEILDFGIMTACTRARAIARGALTGSGAASTHERF